METNAKLSTFSRLKKPVHFKKKQPNQIVAALAR
jgi:hypothetical protein